MPELPEVETVRRTLAELLIGRRVARVHIARPDVVRGLAKPSGQPVGRPGSYHR